MSEREEEDFYEEYGDLEDSFTLEPQRMSKEIFEKRNDPAPLMEAYKLELMNAYLKKEIKKNKDGEEVIVQKLRLKKKTKPVANKEGVEGITSYVSKVINNHVVQGHITTEDSFKNTMRAISADLTIHFVSKRKQWEIKINDIDVVIVQSVNLIELFLTRTLFNKERESYGEGFKETTNRSVKADEKAGFWQKIGGFMLPKQKA